VQQRREGDGDYRFQRKSANPIDTLPGDGYGAPTRKVGLIHSAFRPSDDACVFPFHVPSNHFAVVSLRQLAAMAEPAGLGARFAQSCTRMAGEVAGALEAHGTMRLPDGSTVWAYEVDGYGNALFLDDANIPGLASLPCIGACAPTDPRYLATRRAVFSEANPYFFTGRAASGVGGPHIGRDMVWPMSLMVQAMSAQDPLEIEQTLGVLARTTAGTGFMHESFHKDDPGRFTRAWFAWANSLYGEAVLDAMDRAPARMLR